MATKVVTRIDAFRKLGTRSRGPTAEDTIVIDMLSEFDEDKEAIEAYKDERENVDLDQLGEVVDAFVTLVSERGLCGGDDQQVSDLREAFKTIELSLGVIDADAAEAFIDAYDAVTSAWDDYVGIKEQDRYDGKGDDVAGAWDEIVGAIEQFVEAAEALGIS